MSLDNFDNPDKSGETLVRHDDLTRTLYEELRKLAGARISRLAPGQTLQPTDLVHEAWERLKSRGGPWNSRGHFFGAAAHAMRDVLVDHARHKGAIKRGGDRVRVEFTIDLRDSDATLSSIELLSLHEALDRLREAYPTHIEIVMLRFFAGLEMATIAEHLDISLSTVERRWRFARAWLQAQMEGEPAIDQHHPGAWPR